jgi:hypothetical protein
MTIVTIATLIEGLQKRMLRCPEWVVTCPTAFGSSDPIADIQVSLLAYQHLPFIHVSSFRAHRFSR